MIRTSHPAQRRERSFSSTASPVIIFEALGRSRFQAVRKLLFLSIKLTSGHSVAKTNQELKIREDTGSAECFLRICTQFALLCKSGHAGSRCWVKNRSAPCTTPWPYRLTSVGLLKPRRSGRTLQRPPSKGSAWEGEENTCFPSDHPGATSAGTFLLRFF